MANEHQTEEKKADLPPGTILGPDGKPCKVGKLTNSKSRVMLTAAIADLYELVGVLWFGEASQAVSRVRQ